MDSLSLPHQLYLLLPVSTKYMFIQRKFIFFLSISINSCKYVQLDLEMSNSFSVSSTVTSDQSWGRRKKSSAAGALLVLSKLLYLLVHLNGWISLNTKNKDMEVTCTLSTHWSFISDSRRSSTLQTKLIRQLGRRCVFKLANKWVSYPC